jgi:hypothetical protein
MHQPSSTPSPVSDDDRRSYRHRMLQAAAPALLTAALAGCADHPQTPVTAEAEALHATFKNLSGWSVPTALAELNTPVTEGCPFVTRSGDALYFASNRLGGYGLLDLYVSRWQPETQTWSAPENLGPEINTNENEQCPLVLNSGKEMIFVSNRPGTTGGLDLWSSTRHDHRDHLGWGPPTNLTILNTPQVEFGPGAYEEEDGTTVIYFNSNRAGGAGQHDLYVSARPAAGTFGSPSLVAELSSEAQEQFAALSKDGREIVFSSDRIGTIGRLDLWSATRAHTSDPWGSPVNLGANVNSTADEGRSAFSWDGHTLLFHSNRSGNVDLYQSSRSRVTGRRN